MNIFKKIFIPVLSLAFPLILIQLCQASLGLIDTIVAGRYNYQDLAGVGLGTNIWSPVFILFTGILYVIVPKFSELQHSENIKEKIILLQQGKNIAFILAIIGFLIIQFLAFISPFFIKDAFVANITKNYLHLVAFAIPGLIYMVLYRFVSEGHSQLKPVIITVIVLLFTNTILCFYFVNGYGFFPEMGGAGTGLATAISAYVAFFIMRYLVENSLTDFKNKKYPKVSIKESMVLLKQGLPIGVAFILQILALAILAFFAANLGTKIIAAHQIVINIAMMIIMIPIAISSATTIRISYFSALINHQREEILTSISAIFFTFIYSLITAILLLIFASEIIEIFSRDKVIVNVASGLIIYVAIFQVFDALQMVAAGILRGFQKFIPPLLAILICYWFIILPLSYFMGVRGWLQPFPNINIIWIVLSAGMIIAAIFLVFESYRVLSLRRNK
ncbi:MATE family efflux transporter [Acinetobacter qingfengensis]|uniref:MATE family efflux transporter n=1 Tax=Acinetobacter qingfengensis TaxID=1262585 RepID=A0A1E7QY62_9GAMM|nr:MATE family efflux transporter [Acinetobacter qingfengensis]KAA8734722.1 MATE family efflux transporter [Acinetobacter qingfengensis]OEY92018.1 MATE family efflux transporter [Acinetobacter qingfengensis]